MSWSQSVGRALRASVARAGVAEPFGDVVSSMHPDELQDLVPAAMSHGIGGYVSAAAQGVEGPPDDLRQQLSLLRDHALIRHLHVFADLKNLAEVLDEAEVPWLVVKGPVLAEVFHGHPTLRTYADIDVLVPPERLGDALDAFEGAGCAVLDRNWTLLHKELKGELHVALPAGSAADVHWHLLNDREVRDGLRMRTGDLFERAQDVRVGDVTVRTLDDVDTVVYLALHTMLSGGHRLIWLKDIERALERGPDPAAVECRAREWGAELILHTALQRTALAVGLPPAATALRPRGAGTRLWLGLSGLTWRRAPAEREDGSESIGRVIARSGRQSAAASARMLAHKARVRFVDRTPDFRRSEPDPNDPRSGLLHESGGPEARRAYLEEVRRLEGLLRSGSPDVTQSRS